MHGNRSALRCPTQAGYSGIAGRPCAPVFPFQGARRGAPSAPTKDQQRALRAPQYARVKILLGGSRAPGRPRLCRIYRRTPLNSVGRFATRCFSGITELYSFMFLGMDLIRTPESSTQLAQSQKLPGRVVQSCSGKSSNKFLPIICWH